MSGVYGWYCKCGFDTRATRGDLPPLAAVCYACHVLEESPKKRACDHCGRPLTQLGEPGTFVEAGDRARVEAYWRERLFDETLRERWHSARRPKPPFPTDATPALPGWSQRTPQTAAYDAWFHEMFESWPREKPKALADAELVARVEREIEPIVPERVEPQLVADRKYKCPRCGELELVRFAVPFPT